MSSQSIFREEALEERNTKLQGSVVISTPQPVVYFSIFIMLSVLVFAVVSSMVKFPVTKEFPGIFKLSQIVQPLIVSKAGYILEVHHETGDLVEKGEPIVTMVVLESESEKISQQLNSIANKKRNKDLILENLKSQQLALSANQLHSVASYESEMTLQNFLLENIDKEIRSVESKLKEQVRAFSLGLMSESELNALQKEKASLELEQNRVGNLIKTTQSDFAISSNDMKLQSSSIEVELVRVKQEISVLERNIESLENGFTYQIESLQEGVFNGLDLGVGQLLDEGVKIGLVASQKIQYQGKFILSPELSAHFSMGEAISLSYLNKGRKGHRFTGTVYNLERPFRENDSESVDGVLMMIKIDASDLKAIEIPSMFLDGEPIMGTKVIDKRTIFERLVS